MRFLHTGLLLGIALSLSSQAQAQSLATPVPPPMPQPVPPRMPPATTGPSLNQPGPSQPAIPNNPSQRAESGATIQSAGPATQLNQLPQPVSGQTPVYGAPVDVMDARGRSINGAVQVGPNRVYVPSTGKYHNTLTAGEQQRIVP